MSEALDKAAEAVRAKRCKQRTEAFGRFLNVDLTAGLLAEIKGDEHDQKALARAFFIAGYEAGRRDEVKELVDREPCDKFDEMS